jgi:peptidoglycan hydrolase-like protein with peptidoglycan-binding domain
LSDAPRLTEDDFIRDKPVEADEPTLRFGDQSVDGWVEYLQRLLVVKGQGPLEDNGTFDDATLAAVRAFQQRMNTEPNTPSTGRVFVDGVVGNQTWALLREEDAPPPSTDGRQPHSFVELGREARWLTEDSAFVFLKDDDRLVIQGVSTGDTPIESGVFNARFLIVLPNAETVVRDRPIFTANGQPAAPGDLIFSEFEGAASRSLNVENPLQATSFSFQAFMPAELGGDTTQSLNVSFI